MIKLLLADDNRISLDYFSNLINWNELGFEIVSVAVDGEEAFADFCEFHPEVIITDIQMPCMTGIELAEKVKEISPDTIIIFLSSYEEFNYVRSALNLGIFDYILKHETNKNVLIEKLNAVKTAMNRYKEKDRYYQESLLWSMIHSYEEENQRTFDIPSDSFSRQNTLLLVEQTHILPVIETAAGYATPEIKEWKLKRLCYDTEKEIVALIKIKPYQYLVVIKFDVNSLLNYTYELKSRLTSSLKEDFSIMILAENKPIGECINIYMQNRELFNQKYFFTGPVILYTQQSFTVDEVSIASTDLENMKYYFQNGQYQKFFELIDKLYNYILHKKDYVQFENVTIKLLLILKHYHNQMIDFSSGYVFTVFDDHASIHWKNAISLMNWIKNLFYSLTQMLETNQNSHYSPEVKRALQYISQEYANSDLSAEIIAENMDMSINNLNKIFKKDTGETVWKMLTAFRMNQAKKLINSNEYKISEICTLVGYKSLSYFSTVFKKTHNITPQEYRRIQNEVN